jgi:hypothetical protein
MLVFFCVMYISRSNVDLVLLSCLFAVHQFVIFCLLNRLLKYADDCSLVCPENSNTTVETEMNHVMDWARDNKMIVNLLKTMELVFHRPNLSRDILPLPLPDIVR